MFRKAEKIIILNLIMLIRFLSSFNCYTRPEAGFYLWMNVGNGEKFTKELYKNFNLKVMPGKYLSEGGKK